MNKKYVLFLMLCGLYAGSMDVAPQSADQEKMFKFSTANSDGKIIEISEQILGLSSTLVDMINDLAGDNSSAISLNNISYKTLFRLAKMLEFYLQRNPSDSLDKQKKRVYKIANAYSVSEIVDIINAANYLGIDENVLKVFADAIINLIKERDFNYEILRNISSDFAEKYIVSYMKEELISYIRERILVERASKRKTFFKHFPSDSTDTLVAGCFFQGSANMVLENSLGVLGVYNAVNDQLETSLDIPGDNIGALSIATHENLVAAGLTNNQVFVWNVENKKDIRFCQLQADIESVTSLSFSQDGKYLIGVGDSDAAHVYARNRLYLWDLSTINWDKPIANKGFFLNYERSFNIASICAVPDISADKKSYNNFIIGLFENTNKYMTILRVSFSAETGFIINQIDRLHEITIKNPESFILKRIVFNKNGSKIAVAYEDKMVIYDIEDRSSQKEIISSLHKIESTVFSPDDRLIACGGANKILVYDIAKAKLLIELDALHKNRVISFSKDGQKMLSVLGYSPNDHNRLGVWRLFTNEESNGLKELAQLKIDIVVLAHVYKATLLGRPAKISRWVGLPHNLKILFNNFGLIEEITTQYEPVLEDASVRSKESDFIKSPEPFLQQDVVPGVQQNVPAQGRLQQWWEWFKNKPWENIFGSAMKRAAGA